MFPVPPVVKSSMMKKNTIVIDVGIHRVESTQTKSGYKLVGDVDFEDTVDIASKITPVHGGVGPMTIACLLLNTLQTSYSQFKVDSPDLLSLL